MLSPLGLPGRAVICTRANRRSVRGAALSLQAAVLRLLQRSLFLFTLHRLSPSFLSIWLCLASSLRCLYSACLDCSFLFVCLQEIFFFRLAAKLNVLTVDEILLLSKKKAHQLFSCAPNCKSDVIKKRLFSYTQRTELPSSIPLVLPCSHGPEIIPPPPPSWRIVQSLK